jgi:FPC/CPF motif-containing protein YcgG
MRTEQEVEDAFHSFIGDPRYPCLAARGVWQRRDYQLNVYGTLGSAAASEALAAHLAAFARDPARSAEDYRFAAFVAVFTGPAPASEVEFERGLWHQLQQLHERDDPEAEWDPAVSADPSDPRFSFSFAGTALFVIGLHPESSRLARRFQWPALVFNPRSQFQRLRRDGRFDRLRDLTRARDVDLQGSANPNLSNFGERSEARQYSGRDTSQEEWRCPFHHRQ